MKKCVAMILTVLLTLSALAALADGLPDSSFSEEEYQRLRALQWDGYQRMPLSAFGRRIAELTDSEGYGALLERFWESETLDALKDTDETAAFLFYELPLAGDEGWRRSYDGEVRSSSRANAARLEYSLTLTVLRPDVVMVKDYTDMRLGAMDVMRCLLVNRTEEELRDGAAMRASIQDFLNAQLPDLSTPEVRVEIEFAYFPPAAAEGARDNAGSSREARRTPHGTQEDYRTLLTLKTQGVEDMTLGDFRAAVLDWADGHRESMERIDEDIVRGEIAVPLTDEERGFVTRTVWLSGVENGKAIEKRRTGQTVCPYVAFSHNMEDGAAWCSLDGRFSYSIPDAGQVTVGERDRQIENMIQAIRSFWNDAGVENLVNIDERDVLRALRALAQACSTGQIAITIDEAQVHFERMDERALEAERTGGDSPAAKP